MNPKLVKFGSGLWELIKVVAISLAIVLPVRYFVVQPFYVKGASMEPNFHDYQYLFIDEISYRFNDPVRGQVIVMRDPLEKSKYFIKRIIGLPGELIEVKDGGVYINSVQLEESAYLDQDVQTYAISEHAEVQLGDQEYYVMGDNRAASFDSRRFGPIARSEFVGRVWVRVWPFNYFKVY